MGKVGLSSLRRKAFSSTLPACRPLSPSRTGDHGCLLLMGDSLTKPGRARAWWDCPHTASCRVWLREGDLANFDFSRRLD